MRAYGHETDGVTAVPDEAAHLAAAAARLLEEKKTLADTADWMTENAGPTVSGRPWAPTTLRRRLQNPAIAGLKENAAGELVPGPAEQLIDRETFDALQKLFEENKKGQGTSRSTSTTCRAGRRPRPRAGSHWCPGPQRTADGDTSARPRAVGRCGSPPSRWTSTSESEWSPVYRVRRTSSVWPALRDKYVNEAREAERFLKEELSDHKTELAHAFGAKDMNLSEYRTAKAALEVRRTEAMAAVRRGKALEQLPELTPKGVETWWNETAGREQRRNLVQLVVREVRVGPATVRGSRKFDEARFEIFWRWT